MILLAGFLDVLFHALVFIGLALSIGGIVFYYAVLGPLRTRRGAEDRAARKTASLVAFGAFLVAASQLLALLTAGAALAGETGRWPIATLLGTGFARASIIHAAFAIVLGCVALYLCRRPQLPRGWAAATASGALVLASGAWLVHGASRLENAAALMSVTVLHQLGAAAWIGGMMHLTAQWRLLRRFPSEPNLWPRMLSRFSPLALTSVALMVIAGVYLSWEYIGGLAGLLGTAYGTMLLTKIALMAALLLLGGINNLTIRHWKLTGDREEVFRRVPVFAEVEAGIGVVILMAAAALTSQPPAIDVLAQRATPAEVLAVFAPKMPVLVPPPRAEMLATASSSLDPFALPSNISRMQSDFNHNVSGILVILTGIGAFLSRATKWRWARHWPVMFLPLALFLVIIVEPNGWPLGPEGFWATLVAPEVLQHRLATALVIALGFVEWRVQTGPLAPTRWRYMFPLICGVGGALLLTHSHSVFAIKRAFLIEVSHNAIGICAVLAGAGAWLELRMSGREGRIAGLLWPIFLTLVGVVLLFYREA